MGPCCSDRDQNPAVTPSTLPTKHTGTGALALPRHPVPAGLPARLRPPLPRLRPCGCSTSWSPGPNGSWGARQEGGCSPRLLLRSSSSSSSPRGPAWVIGVLGVEVKHGGRGSEARRFPKKKERARAHHQEPSTPRVNCGCMHPWVPLAQALVSPRRGTALSPPLPGTGASVPVPVPTRCPPARTRSAAWPSHARLGHPITSPPDPAVSPPARVQPGWLGHGHCCGMIHCSPEQMYGCLRER